MRVTSKGQVTIPVDIRERLGLHAGSVVEMVVDGEEVRLRKATDTPGRGQEVLRRLEGAGTVSLTTDEIMALTRR